MPEIEIRYNPNLKSFLRNITEMGFTGFIWGLWVYLFLPVLNILLWLVGIRFFYFGVIEQVGYRELFDLFNNMGWTILIVFLVLRVWGYYNYIRYGKRSRRKINLPLSMEQLAKHFQVPVEDIKNLQSKKEVNW